MALFDFKNREKNLKQDLFSIPCNYDGYDFMFKDHLVRPEVYEEITNLLTNNQLNLTMMSTYQAFKECMNADTFIDFYDDWINELKNKKYVIHLDQDMNMTIFTHEINELLKAVNSNIQINVNKIVEEYKDELKQYSIDHKDITNEINYDILEANVMAEELRKNGYELICLFNGYDNDDKALISIDKINKLKELENVISQ